MKHTTIERIVKDFILLGLIATVLVVTQLFYSSILRFFPFFENNNTAAVFLAVLITFLIYRTYDKRITSILNRTLFMPQHIRRIQIAHLDEELLEESRIEELSALLVEKIISIFGIEQLALFVLDEENSRYRLAKEKGLPEKVVSDTIPLDGVIRELCEKRKNVIYKKSYYFLSWQDAVGADNFFERYNTKVILPFFCEDKLIAFLSIGDYQRIGKFQQDIASFYHTIAKYAGIAFKNALQFEKAKSQFQTNGDTQGAVLQKLKLEAIDKLATGIAHEIRNPLTIISLKAQTMLRKKEPHFSQEEMKSALELIVKQISRASNITSRLIRFGRKGDAPEMVSFSELIEDVVKMISYNVALEDIKIIKILDPNLPGYLALISDMRELFLNLILNAVESVERGGSIFIHACYDPANSRIAVHIADNGIGKKPEGDSSAVFDPFFTMKDNQKVGLGLYNCQKIVNQYNGSLRFEKNNPKGVDVLVTLPVQTENKEVPGFAVIPKSAAITNKNQESEVLPFETMKDIVFNQQEVVHDQNADRR